MHRQHRGHSWAAAANRAKTEHDLVRNELFVAVCYGQVNTTPLPLG